MRLINLETLKEVNTGEIIRDFMGAPFEVLGLINQIISEYKKIIDSKQPIDSNLKGFLMSLQKLFPNIDSAWISTAWPESQRLQDWVTLSALVYKGAKLNAFQASSGILHKGPFSKDNVSTFLFEELGIDDGSPATFYEKVKRHSYSSSDLAKENSPSVLARELVADLFQISVSTLEKRLPKKNHRQQKRKRTK